MSVIRFANNGIRFDLQIIASWIKPGSKVLDLGCGEGYLLRYLIDNKAVKVTGIEINEKKVEKCIEKGLTVIQGDINEEILEYSDNTFDYVIVSQTLQQIYKPAQILREVLRVGRYGIVSFPNFSHWKVRAQLLFTGYAPVTESLPYEWYITPNIRVITIKDFRRFSHEAGFRILKEVAISTTEDQRAGKIIRILPTLRASHGIFLIGKKEAK